MLLLSRRVGKSQGRDHDCTKGSTVLAAELIQRRLCSKKIPVLNYLMMLKSMTETFLHKRNPLGEYHVLSLFLGADASVWERWQMVP